MLSLSTVQHKTWEDIWFWEKSLYKNNNNNKTWHLYVWTFRIIIHFEKWSAMFLADLTFWTSWWSHDNGRGEANDDRQRHPVFKFRFKHWRRSSTSSVQSALNPNPVPLVFISGLPQGHCAFCCSAFFIAHANFSFRFLFVCCALPIIPLPRLFLFF